MRVLAALFILALPVLPVAAEEGASICDQPVVIELFTSQSCYSCPPAEDYLASLADNPDYVTLEWHVDYWDDLVYGAKGQWKDPYSSHEWTKRQRRYNANILGEPKAYTPQAVINGAAEAVGSRKSAVQQAIKTQPPAPVAAILVSEEGSTLTIKARAQDNADVWLVRFIDEQTTDVPRGENAGKTLSSRHVVTGIERLGQAGDASLSASLPERGAGCAILVQEPDQGRILAARYCDV